MTAPTSTDDLRRLMESLRLPAGVECEFVRVESERRSMGWAAGAADSETMSKSAGCAVRVIENGGQGLVKETELTDENARALVDRALLIARNTPRDPNRFLNSPSAHDGPTPENDGAVFTRPVEAVLAELRALEKKALATSPKLKKVVRLHVSEEREHKTIVTNRGVSLSAESTGTGFLVELLAEEDGQTEVAWDGVGRRFGGDIPFEKVVLDAAQTAVQSLGGKPLPSGLYTVLLHPRVGTQLLSLLAQALSAEAVQTNRSFLRNRLGEKVGSSDITVLDDPGLPRGAASVLFDDEGAPSQKLAMIEKGVLKNTFFDLRTAKKQGAAPNGRGFRASLAAAPAPHPTNLYIASGPHSLDHLLSSEKKVFLLHDIMGLHMAEPVTGEFSLGAAGFLYENGRLAQPVRGMTMAGTVGGLLENATAAGNEIHWASSMGAPYVLVKNITLSGN
jgi:PmbA protein